MAAIEALRDALSVCSPVSVSNDRKIVRDGCTLYAQTEEWCKWAEHEVAPKLIAAIEALAATPAPAPAQEPVTLTEAERVKCLVDAGCIGTVKMTYDSGPYEITRTSINADRLIEAVIAALRAKEAS